jgi:UDP-N-acetylglucosamine diphosphorylase / glucose-1-phosphate thymidylyltransferase / UDP-N-acetylgalactosamine diphosphorylase / glucosamine-1-phosphate N-acetyltransferase / galactosamine-1-phosphate N-acetyltransferase
MQIILFEDEFVTRLHPVTLGRPAYNVSCASYRLVDWMTDLARETGALLRSVVRPHLATLQQVDFPQFSSSSATNEVPALLVNARLTPSVANQEALREMVAEGRPGIVASGSALGAAYIDASGPRPPTSADAARFGEYLHQAVWPKLPRLDGDLAALDYPHDLIRQNLQIMGANLEHRLRSGRFQEIADGVFTAAGAKLGQHVVADTTQGPVLLDEEASVGPHCFLRGPAYLGPKCRVTEHSAIKDCVSLGHTSKIGGEVEASIIEPYSNKQHYGFLGHSYLGSWINLGAGTCNSDLKNTYGNVKMEYRGDSVATGMQFVGCIMGDYAKSAINTGIFTGKTIGVCSMVYGFVTTNVPSFVNYARLFGQVTELPPEVMIATQQRMFARRNVAQRPCDAQLIHDMYELTRHERQLAGEPLSL